jgi:tyrosyl-tRNA synthetase
MEDIVRTLEERGFLAALTDPEMQKLFREKPVTLYAGFDPTAPSLHVGNLLVIMGLAQFQRHGHTPIAVVGGGTGLIGDPSGKTKERQLLGKDELEFNLQGIKQQLERFLDFSPALSNPARLVNNADWLFEFKFVDFLRDVGKHFRLGEMLAKESVKDRKSTRLNSSH